MRDCFRILLCRRDGLSLEDILETLVSLRLGCLTGVLGFAMSLDEEIYPTGERESNYGLKRVLNLWFTRPLPLFGFSGGHWSMSVHI